MQSLKQKRKPVLEYDIERDVYVLVNTLDYLPDHIKRLQVELKEAFEEAYGHPMVAYLTIYDSDSKGRPIEGGDIVTLPSKSFTKGWQAVHSCQMTSTSNTINDTGGASRTSSAAHANNLDTGAPSGTTTYGIVIGTGVGAAAVGDEKLGTQYTNTTNFTHGLSAGSAFAVAAPASTFTFTRTFTNSTGGNLSYTEVGIYCQWSASAFKICVARDLSSFTINNGAAKTVTYTYQVTGSS